MEPQIQHYPEIRAVVDVSQLPFETIISKDRHQKTVFARITCAFYLKSKRGYSQNLIGDLIGKDHATVCHYLKTARELYNYHKPYRRFLDSCNQSYKKLLQA